MPVTGRKPKPEGLRRNRVRPVYDWVEVPDVPFVGGPKLPRQSGWPALTKRWWEVVSSMPHCVIWKESDWQFAMDTALLVAAFHAGDMKVAAELRAREKVLGTTADARRDLRIRYVDSVATDPSEGASVTALAEYRQMLGDADAD